MSECCSTSGPEISYPKKYRCPVDGKEYGLVSATTIKHHISQPWNWEAREQGYYFCEDPECDVVYFGQDDSVIKKSALRTEIGIKEKSRTALVCYCYGVTVAEAIANPDAKAFVMQETKRKSCACATRNPSGKCCLANFPKA